MSTAVDVFRSWLGPSGRPPPLDRFLGARKVGWTVGADVERLCARAVAVAGRTFPRVEPGGERLLDQLRALPRRALVRATGELPDELRRAREGVEDWPARCVVHGIPPGFAPYLARWAAAGGASAAWLAAQDHRPPLWLRATRPGAADRLRGEGFLVEEVGDGALRVEGPTDVRGTATYREGAVEIQDLASQRVGALGPLGRGDRAWDVCAGRGGKTLQLAARLGGRGVVCATDVDPKKLDELRTRVRRAGLADLVRIRPWDGEAVPDFGPEVRRGFALALVDAPCSASGTWRRNPDARLRTDPADVPGFSVLQRKLLALARAASPRGTVVYGTCSVFVEEDEDVAGPGRRFGPPELDADTLFGAVLPPPSASGTA